MKYALTTIFSFFILVSYSQDTLQGCLFLDFENIDDLDLFEGFEISDQFEDEFGLTFSLEGGGFPVLAEIGGSPAAAYGSAWGNDTRITTYYFRFCQPNRQFCRLYNGYGF